MEAIKTLNPAIEFAVELTQDAPAIVELGELQLAMVGGGTGDVAI